MSITQFGGPRAAGTRGLLSSGVAALTIALCASVLGTPPAHAAPIATDGDASAEVAAQVDATSLDAAVEDYVSGNAASAAELASTVAPESGQDLNGAAGVNLGSDGSLVLTREQLGDLDLGISAQGSDSEPEIVDGAAVSTDVDTDLDVVARATAQGAQLLAVLGSENAPREIPFNLDLPEGAKLAEQPDGSIAVNAPVATEVPLPGEEARIEAAAQEILGDDLTASDHVDGLTDEQIEALAAIPDAQTHTVSETQKVAEIATPWAVDANGDPVATRFELDGATLVQIVETNADTAFPVVADPSVWWWTKNIAICVAQIATILVPGKIAAVAAKIAKMAKSNKNVRRALDAIDEMGGLKKALGYLKTYIQKKGDGLSAANKRRVEDMLKYGGNMLAEAMGIGTCYTVAKEIL